ncbi:MAG TPA: hypothetical protein VIV11_05000 [Kofleriaceae bacterium]
MIREELDALFTESLRCLLLWLRLEIATGELNSQLHDFLSRHQERRPARHQERRPAPHWTAAELRIVANMEKQRRTFLYLPRGMATCRHHLYVPRSAFFLR